ncbi:ABC transporter substrate-binding protein [Rhodococcus sp. YH1]|uniref:ABC transporter substrate-binding protein n=1 Tax=Rhodococcus sp. YH1 TaxID=89066 RepID=UPI00138709E9
MSAYFYDRTPVPNINEESDMSKTRRMVRLAGALCALLTATACGGVGELGAANAGDDITLGYQGKMSILAALVAEDQGIFEDRGVAVEFMEFTSIPAMTTAVAEGQLDVAFTTPVTVAQYNQGASGAQMRMLAACCTFQYTAVANEGGPIAASRDGNWIEAVRTWRGATIGVPALGGSYDILTRNILREAGLDPDRDVAIVAVATGQPAVSALQVGSADIVVSDRSGAAVTLDAGIGQIVFDLRSGDGPASLRDAVVSGYVSRADALDGEHAEDLLAFRDGLEDARRFILDPANEEAVKSAITEAMGLGPEATDLLYRSIDQYDVALDRETVELSSAAYIDEGLLPAGFTYDGLVLAGADR